MTLLSEELIARLAHLKKLPAGWDGPGTLALRPEALEHAEGVRRNLCAQYPAFHEPAIVPKFDGTLQLEWHSDQRSLELDLTDAGWEILGEVATSEPPAFFTADVGLLAGAQLHLFYEWWMGERDTWPA